MSSKTSRRIYSTLSATAPMFVSRRLSPELASSAFFLTDAGVGASLRYVTEAGVGDSVFLPFCLRDDDAKEAGRGLAGRGVSLRESISSSVDERVLVATLPVNVAVVCLVMWRALEGVGSERPRLRGGGAVTMGGELWGA